MRNKITKSREIVSHLVKCDTIARNCVAYFSLLENKRLCLALDQYIVKIQDAYHIISYHT